MKDLFTYATQLLFSTQCILTNSPPQLIEKHTFLSNIQTTDKNEKSYVEKKIIIKNITKKQAKRYYEIVKMYQTNHYWLGIYNPNPRFLQNSLVFYNKDFVPYIYETSIMRVLENTENKDDYHLSFITTDISFIRGYYTWKLQYHRKKNQIIITISKQGCINGNWIASSIITKSFLQTHNISAIDSELHALRNYITHGKKNENIAQKI